MLEHGANPNIQKEDGSSAISMAAKSKDSEWLELVLKHKGNPNLVDSIHVYEGMRNQTPLFDAVSSRNLRNIIILIKAGANIDHQDQGGTTPVIEAASRRWYACVLYLLESGADWRILNINGHDLAFVCFGYAVVKSYAPDSYRNREKQAKRLVKRLRRHRKELFAFLDQAGVPFDNNHAERIIRPAVTFGPCSFFKGAATREPQPTRRRLPSRPDERLPHLETTRP